MYVDVALLLDGIGLGWVSLGGDKTKGTLQTEIRNVKAAPNQQTPSPPFPHAIS